MIGKEESVTIEFFGLPASGKSTLSRILEAKLDNKKKDVTNTTNEIIHQENKHSRYTLMIGLALTTLIRCPIQSLRIASAINASKQESRVRVLRLWLYRKAQFKDRIDLLDQGIYQALWSIGITATNNESELYKSIYEQFPKPYHHIVVIVEIEAECSLRRLRDRKTNPSRVKSLFDNNPERTIRICEGERDKVLDLIDNTCEGKSVYCIDTEDTTPQESTIKLLNELNS
jgi:thymidylate kinase